MELKNLNSIYFVGIGGIGMSALARYFNAIGVRVGGYDKTETELTKKLVEEDVFIHFDDTILSIPEQFKDTNALIVYTPAIPSSSKILEFYKQNGNVVLKRSEVLGMITVDNFAVAVAGTHGKTTTSSMIAHVLKNSGMGCNAFLGGIATNYHSNLILDKAAKIAVVEADEYDRSFLTLSPNIAVVTSTDADHLDIYGGHDLLLQSFKEFVNKIPYDGWLIMKDGLSLQHKNLITYGFEESANVKAKSVKVVNGNYVFDVQTSSHTYENIQVGLPGRHNLENALATIAVCELLEVSKEEIIKALACFKGVKRRFERIISNSDLTYIDDYAHHPKELEMCITSVKELYPNKKVTGIFQPHLFSRTRDFAEGFAKSLDLLDDVILMNIYPARELPVEGVDSKMLKNLMQNQSVKIVADDKVVDEVKSKNIEVLLTLGAGDIDRLVEPLKLALS